MLIKLTNNFEQFVTNEITKYDKIEDIEIRKTKLTNLRTFYQKICTEANQKVDSLRFILAVRHIELITSKLKDDYPINELAELINKMKANNMYIGIKNNYIDKKIETKYNNTKDKKVESVKVGFNK